MNIKLKYLLLIICVVFSIPTQIFANEIPENIADITNPISNFNCENINQYERPYSLLENCPQKNMIRANTGLFLVGAVGSMGLLYLMPESITGWNKNTFTLNNLFGKWKENVSAGPVIDNDAWLLNYVAHPYCGAIYYMDARSVGYNAFYSFLYSAGMSTFMWEYGFEALAEVPSLNDIIVTPIAGAVVGELFYLAKREIIQNNYYVLNSKIIGHSLVFLMDPVNEIAKLFIKDRATDNLNTSLIVQPNYVGMSIRLNIE
jgi:hypothetical protein